MSPKYVTIPCAIMDGLEIRSYGGEYTVYKLPVDVQGLKEVVSLDAYFPDEFVKKRVELFSSGHLLWLYGVLWGQTIFVIDAWFMRQPLEEEISLEVEREPVNAPA